MSRIRRRDFLFASAAMGVAEMPLRLPWGPNPLDPRQPRPQVLIPTRPPPKNPIYTQRPAASPVHLSSSIVLAPGSSGTVPIEALKNPMGQDMELLEIKFELSGSAVGGLVAAFGATIGCELMLGQHKITGSAVPVWNFGRAENLTAETKYDNNAGGDDLAFVSYSWRLPRPLYIPAGAVLTPKFSHNGMVAAAVNTRVGYSARTIFARPKVLYMPWVASYKSKAFNPISAAGVDNSSELDLVNPHPEVLHLQRFVGRALVISAADGSTGELGSQAFCSQSLSLRMTDSYGRPVVRDYTVFDQVFSALTRSWDMDNGAGLDPQSYYLVNLKKAAATYGVGNTNDSAQAFISMVGWRELGAA